MFKVYVDGKEINSELVQHSDGAINLKIDSVALENAEKEAMLCISPVMNITLAESVIELASFIFDTYVPFYAKITLNLPYFPNARADRQFQDGMTIPLKAFCNQLHSQNWDNVYTKDLHNLKATKLLYSKIQEMTQAECFDDTVVNNVKLRQFLENYNFSFCAPDKGASLKVASVANGYTDNIIQLSKCRDVFTGNIQGIDIVSGDVKEKDILIIDDICDGGMTFISAAKELKYNGAKSVSLYVTHGIFSKGVRPFKGIVDYIFANQVVSNYITMDDIDNYNSITY